MAESPAIFTEVVMGCGTYVPPFCRKSCYGCYGRGHCFYGSRVTGVIIGSAAILKRAAIFTVVVFCMWSEAVFLRKRKHSTEYYYNV